MLDLRDWLNASVRKIPVGPLYILGVVPAFWFLWLGLFGGLGVEPIKALEHKLGEIALQLLIAGLTITPLRRHLGVNLIRFRRMIGLLTFFYVCCHLLVWLVLDVQIPREIWADILKRPYITVGMAAFALMIPLAVTSNNWSVRRLGPAWRRLHKAVYACALLGSLHFVMLTKGFQFEPLIYLGVVLMLLALRLPAKRNTARS